MLTTIKYTNPRTAADIVVSASREQQTYLLGHHPRHCLHVGDERGRVEEARLGQVIVARLVDVGALVTRRLHELADGAHLALVHQRTHVHRLVQLAAHAQVRHARLQLGNHLLVYSLLNQHF